MRSSSALQPIFFCNSACSPTREGAPDDGLTISQARRARPGVVDAIRFELQRQAFREFAARPTPRLVEADLHELERDRQFRLRSTRARCRRGRGKLGQVLAQIPVVVGALR